MKRFRLLALPLLLALAASCLPTEVCGCSPAPPEATWGRVLESGTGEGVPEVVLELLDTSSLVLETTLSDATGSFRFETRTPYDVPFAVRLTPPQGWTLAEGQTNPRETMVTVDRPAEPTFLLERR